MTPTLRAVNNHLLSYVGLNLTPIPLKPRSKKPLVKWGKEWNPTLEELEVWASRPNINWGVRCGAGLAVLDFDSLDSFDHFMASCVLPFSCPIVKTGRGYHIWVRPTKPIRSQCTNDVEIKCLGSYVVAPPSIHPSGVPYIFQVSPDGALPEVDLETLLGLPAGPTMHQISGGNMEDTAPSDFALRYGKSSYPQSLCGLATKVVTRSDGKVKKLVSLRCWKWHCPKCAPLLKRYWIDKLNNLSFRFILKLPTMTKPTAFLRRGGRPDYIHIVSSGESWLFLTGGEAETVWAEAQRAGYELVAGDIAGDPTPAEVRDCLEQALRSECGPLNTRRKITHSRGLLTKASPEKKHSESKRSVDCVKTEESMNVNTERELFTWNSEVLMKPIEEVAKELELEGWHILWKSEVEAIAIKGKNADTQDIDIVELLNMLGVILKKVGKEYIGLCPFHDDHNPSLTVNREKGVWCCHSTRCGKAGNAEQFLNEWRTSKGVVGWTGPAGSLTSRKNRRCRRLPRSET